MPTRTDWLLRFIAGTDGYDSAVDRVRLMKGFFLFQAEGQAPPEVNYRFQPYDYGPFTQEIYRDADVLGGAGLITTSPDGQSYRVTLRGREHLSTLSFPKPEEDSLLDFRVEVTDLGFRELLRRVYKAHPESAARSVARDLLP